MSSELANPSLSGPSGERGLIEAALGQASPRAPSGSFAGDLPPPETFPGYDLIREVHRGGQGAVYQAIQKATKRRVAIKVMHGGPFTGSAGRARFEREVQILGQLNHPNIVGIHDSGVTTDGSFFYVMDYISGRPLDEVIGNGADKKPPVAETLRLFHRICDAVHAAHLRGVIHRDLKPANIRIDQRGEPIVVDFGLAKIAVAETGGESPAQLMTMTGQFIGSLPWASPEQAEGIPDKIDVRTDVYSLGVILYQMLTGRFPYDVVGNMRDVLDNILRAEPARPSTIRRQINDEVETIVLKCLAKDRDRRYQSAGELARDIDHYLQGEPIEAKRDSVGYMLTKTLRRYKLPAAVAAAFVILAVGSSIVMASLYQRSRSATKRAQESASAAQAAASAEQAQRVRADSVSDLALNLSGKLIGEYHDSIRNLVGATKLRMQLLDLGRGYIRDLRAAAGDSPRVQRELAEANERVGDILGGLYERKLGKTDEAEACFAEARALREKLAAAEPGSAAAQSDLARSICKTAEMLRLSGKFAESRKELERALTAFDSASSLSAASKAESIRIAESRAAALRALGGVLTSLAAIAPAPEETKTLLEQGEARYLEAESYWQGRVKADPHEAGPARALAVLTDERARALIALGMRIRESARDVSRQRKPEDAAPGFDAALAVFDRALAIAERALGEFQSRAEQDPASAPLKRDVLLTLHNLGYALAEKAVTHEWAWTAGVGTRSERLTLSKDLHKQALQRLEQALAIAEPLASSDLDNLEAQRDRALCLNKIGNEHRQLGKATPDARLASALDVTEIGKALQSHHDSLDIRQRLYKADPIQRHARDLALGLTKVAEDESLLAIAAEARSAEARQHYLTAADLYRAALDRWGDLVAAGVEPESSRVVQQVRAALETCEAGAAGSP